MRHDFSREFFAVYHAAVFEALGEDAASLHVKGCDICTGNEILRKSGSSGSCPVSQMV